MLDGLAQQGYAVPGKAKEEEEACSSSSGGGGGGSSGSSQPRPIPARAGAVNGAATSPLVMVGPLPYHLAMPPLLFV
jgi:hypothetical protein